MSKCKIDSDCNYLNECVNQVCVHYGIFDPDGNIGLEVFCYILIIIIVGISKVGGIGGGIVKVPIMQLILQYETKQATYLIYPLLFATGVTNAYLMMVQKHPFDNRPLIRYNVSLMMLPTIMVGSSIGVMINQTAPDIVLTIILALFLISITPYLYKQYQEAQNLNKQQQNKEQKQIEMQDIKLEQNDQKEKQGNKEMQNQVNAEMKINEPYLFDQKENSEKNSQQQGSQSKKIEVNTDFQPIVQTQNQQKDQLNTESKDQNAEHNQKEDQIQSFEKETDQQKQLMQMHSSLFQWKKFSLIMLIFLITQFFNFLKGGQALKSFAGIKICADSYWGVFAAFLIVMSICCALVWIWIKHQIKEKEMANFKFGKIDLKFSNKQIIYFVLIGFSAGLFTSATGLGSGLIMVPGLLFAGLDPRSAASVSGFVITFLSSNSLILLLLEGYVEADAIIIYLVMGFLAGTVFAKITYYFMTKYKAHRLVILIVLVVDVLNVLSAIGYLALKIDSKGIDYVMKTGSVCDQK